MVNSDLDQAKKDFKMIREIKNKYRNHLDTLSTEELVKLPEEYFLKCVATCLTPQSYGPRIQKYFQTKYKLKSISPQEGAGDFEAIHSKVEVKVTCLNDTNSKANIVQVRPWQNVDYFIIVVDIRDLDNVQIIKLYLTHEEMKKRSCNWGSAHGTKKVNEVNEHIELRKTLTSKELDEWKSQYESAGLIFEKECLNQYS